MNREIEFRMWNCVKDNPSASKYFYDVENVMECLKQQMLFNSGNKVLGYDHIGDGCAFEQYTGLKDRNGVKVYEGDMDRYGNYVGYWLVMSGFYLTKDGAITGTLTSDFEIASNIHTP